MSSAAPLGVFDSGVGGLSVAREIHALLPAERLLYVADSAYCPYGGRPEAEIRARALAIGRWLVRHGAKLVVVACNTASAAALEALRAELSVPVVGMEPAVKPAAATTRNRRVGVLATEATLNAERFERLMHTYAADVQVRVQPGVGLVELVERGAVQGEEAGRAVSAAVRPLAEAGVDTVVLGCTHYPFLREQIAAALGVGVSVLDTGAAVARQVRRVLSRADALAQDGGGTLEFVTTGDADTVRPVAERLWGAPLAARAEAIG